MDPWLSSGRVVKRHQDHLRHYVSAENDSDQEAIGTPLFPSTTVHPPSADTDRSTSLPQENSRRYPTRDRTVPNRLTFKLQNRTFFIRVVCCVSGLCNVNCGW